MITKCQHKHTKYQPADEAWHCPKCGTDNSKGDFYIEDGVNPECELLHPEDYVKCEACGYNASGTELAKALIKKENLIVCECCKGRGYVKKSS